MSELRAVATIPTDPTSSEAVRAGLAELAEATRAEEGCLAYEVFESAAQPGTYVTIETWRGQDDLDAHLQTPHVAKAFDTLGSALTGEVGIHPLAPL